MTEAWKMTELSDNHAPYQSASHRPLKIYKASAGSGKTFRLAVEYIKLLIDNPLCYKNILAVTFTNKATAEMKQRILSQLYGIAHGLHGSDGYFNEVRNDEHIHQLGLSDEEIRSRAKRALSAMMHDFGRFRIETIDSFFQSIVRELAHELHLTNNLRVDLRSDEVLQDAVKELVGTLTVDSALFRQVLDMAEERILEGRNWNIVGDVTDFGKHIFNEAYLEHKNTGHTTTREDVLHFKNKMKALREQTLDELTQRGRYFLEICERESLDKSCFRGGLNGIYGFFCKTAEGRLPTLSDAVLKHTEDSAHWTTDKHPETAELAERLLIELLKEVVQLRRQLNTCDVSLRHLNQFMLLNTIDSKVRQLNSDENRFLLADTAYMLWQLIRGQDIPFIYEKSGVRFTHIMIDEFQDTSTLQWNNFIPLLINSIATGSKCLLVGDVKQSIYRWRNSDWSILKDIERNAQLMDSVDCQTMEDNYRSAGRVVRFNNDFFTRAAEELQVLYRTNTKTVRNDIVDAYAGVRQHERPELSDVGYVRIELYEKDEEKEALQLDRVVANVQTLRNEGVVPGDISILVRNNKEIPLICAALTEAMPDLHIVSDEAFRLDASFAVHFIVNVLRLIADLDDRFVLATIVYEYHYTVLGDEAYADLNRTFLLDREELHSLLPESFLQVEQQLVMTPLYELAEQVYDLFQLSRIEQQDPYLFTFFDQLKAYLADHSSNIDYFLQYWDETMHEVTIPGGDIDGLRILTIHKSKGLEFDTVIVPFCHWAFVKGTPLIWCKPQCEPFNELDLLPVDANEACRDSFFSNDYAEEKLKSYVDNLNLLYVAFTRAKNRLVVLSTLQGGTKCEDVSYVLSQSLPPMEQEVTDFGSVYTIGEALMPKQTEADHTSNKSGEVNVLTVKPQEISTQFVTQPLQVTFRQSNLATQFLQADEDTQTAHQQRYLNEGVLFHQLLSMIHTADDLPEAVRRMDLDGYFADSYYRDEVMQLVRKALSQTEARNWFDPHWQVINECNILFRDTDGIVKTRRPDRVVTDDVQTIVIDYKTGRQQLDHQQQVQFYVQQLRKMGYPNVSGYVWYIRRGDIVQVS